MLSINEQSVYNCVLQTKKMQRRNVMDKHNLSEEEEIRLTKLFDVLDRNQDGVIDLKDISEAFHHLEVPQMPGQAQRLLDKYDSDRDGVINFNDFVDYMHEHEKHLRLSFEKLDHNKDGFIHAEEVVVAFKNMGIAMDLTEARHLIKRMDRDETLTINYDEWREYLMFHPSSDLRDIVHFWRHANIIDVGEDCIVPDDFTEIELQSGMWWRHLMAGGAAGAVSRTCTAPLDRLKVILQVHGSQQSLGISSGYRHMLQEGGYRSFWRGNGINVLKIAPESAIKFMAYEQIKRVIKLGANRDLYTYERFAAGSLAGAISQSVIYPMEVLKTRLALRKTGQYRGISDCARQIYLKEGVRSFYRGYVPNLLGIIPYAGIDLAVYESLKRFYVTHHSAGEDPGMLLILACGTVSSTCGQLASYPLALVRTKLQAKVTLGSMDTMVGQFNMIIKSEGPRGLYRGITPNFMKVAPAVSISYVVYEHIRKLLGVQMT